MEEKSTPNKGINCKNIDDNKLFKDHLSYKLRTNFYGKSENTITQSGIQTNHSIQTL